MRAWVPSSGQVTARDPDGDDLSYKIVSGNVGGAFKINDKGIISLARDALDFDETPRFNLTVRAEDENGARDTAKVAITVKDVAPPPSDEPLYELGQGTFHGRGRTVDPITLSDDFTIMGRIEFKEKRLIDARDALVGDGNYANGNDLNFYGGKFRLYSSDASPRDVVVSKTIAEDGSDSHYAIVRKDGITKLFIDGKLEDTSRKVWDADFVVSKIGAGVQDNGLGGTIRDLQIYDKALTNGEVRDTATAGVNKPTIEETPPVKETPIPAEPIDEEASVVIPDTNDLAEAVFSILGQTEITGSNSIVHVAPSRKFDMKEASISMFFEADNVSGTKGLLSKDAEGYGGGDHLRARIENGNLIVRFQNEDRDDIDINAGRVKANQEYHLGITFGDRGAEVFLDGDLVGSDRKFEMDWLNNAQYLHIGGDGSSQASGSRNAKNAFDGTISNVMIFDEQLAAGDFADIANFS